jgi:twinkle protein
MRAAPSKASQQKKLTEAVVAWFKTERKISRETLEKLSVAAGTVFFPELKRKTEAVFFGYDRGGWKARSIVEKAYTSEKGFEPHFWGIDDVLASDSEDVYICEGELDRCALVECGLPPYAVLSTPSAAVGKDGTLEYVQKALDEGLARKKRFIWCGDKDDAGLGLRAAFAQIIGPARFYFVEWPDGIKDPNDCLRTDGDDFLLDFVVRGRMPWPAEGLFKMSELPEPKKFVCWKVGFTGWEQRLHLAPGTMSVSTGHPGHGKTTLWTQIWYQITREYDLVTAVASYETRPKPKIRQQLRSLFTKKPEFELLDPYAQESGVVFTNPDGTKVEMSTAQLLRMADRWIDEHYLFMVHPQRRPDLKWLLKQAETAVIRHSAKVLVIDPWNRMEASRESGESETDYIGRCLREIYNFAQDFDIHIQIVAHPSKMSDYRRGQPPELEDISGSKHWDNMPDQGFVVHRPRLFDETGKRDFYCELYHQKSRYDELGYATKLPLEFDPLMSRYGNNDGKLELRKRQQKKQAAAQEGGKAAGAKPEEKPAEPEREDDPIEGFS